MALSFEEFERLAKVWNNGQQIKEHEMQKQNMPAPKYREVPSLKTKRAERTNNDDMKSLAQSNDLMASQKSVRNTNNTLKQTNPLNKSLSTNEKPKSVSRYGNNTTQNTLDMSKAPTSNSLKSTLKTEKAKRSYVNTKEVDKYLDPSYKLSGNETKRAKQMIDDYFDNNEKARKALQLSSSNPYQASKVRAQMSDRERKEYDKMTSLMNKSSNLSAYTYGALNIVPFGNTAMNKLGELAGGDSEYNYSAQKRNVKEQSPIAYGLGDMTSKLAAYATLGPALEKIPALTNFTNGLGTMATGGNAIGGEVLGRIMRGTLADVALDTIPTEVENYKNGMRGADLVEDATNNVLMNTLFNTGGEAASQLFTALKARKALNGATDAVEDAVRTTPKVNELDAERALADSRQSDWDALRAEMNRKPTNLEMEQASNVDEMDNLRRALAEQEALNNAPTPEVPRVGETPSLVAEQPVEEVAETVAKEAPTPTNTLSDDQITYYQKILNDKKFLNEEIKKAESMYKNNGMEMDKDTIKMELQDVARRNLREANVTPQNPKVTPITKGTSKISKLIDSKGMSSIQFKDANAKSSFDNAMNEFKIANENFENALKNAEGEDDLLDAIDELESAYSNLRNATKNGYVTDNSGQGTLRNLKKAFKDNTKGMVINLPDSLRSEMGFTDKTMRQINSTMSSLGGNDYIKFSAKGGTPIDEVWDELVRASGGELDPNAINNADMANKLLEYVEGLKVADRGVEQFDADISNYIPDEYWDDIARRASEAEQKLIDEGKVIASDEGLNPNTILEDEIGNIDKEADEIVDGNNALKYDIIESEEPDLDVNPNSIVDVNGVKERGLSKHIRGEGAMRMEVPDEVANDFRNMPDTYIQLKNADTSAKAERIYNDAINSGKSPEPTFRTMLESKDPAALPLGNMIAKDYSAQGNHEMAASIYRDMGRALTESGQFSQAAAINMMKNDPLTALEYFQKEIDALNKEGAEKYGKKWKDFILSDEEKALFNDIEPGDSDAIKKAIDKIGIRIEKEYPSTFWEKVLEFRRVAMLFNTRTMARNFLANPPTALLRYVADRIEGLGQYVGHLINPDIEITQAIRGSNLDTRKIAKNAWKSDKVQRMFADAPGRLSEKPKAGNFARNKQVFKGGVVSDLINKMTDNGIVKLNAKLGKEDAKSLLELGRNAAYGGMEITDIPLVRENFVSRLGSYIRAKGIKDVSEIPEKAYQIAYEEALKATYKDNSWLVKAIKKAKGSIEETGNAIHKGLGDTASQALIPYVQAPGNIGARIVDYSPLGAVKSIGKVIGGAKAGDAKAIQKGIEEFSKGASGTLMAGLGMALYKSGIITGTLSPDADQRAFEKQNGFREFALRYKTPWDGETKYDDIKWAQPWADTLMTGVLIAQAMEESDKYDNDILRYFGYENTKAGKALGVATEAARKEINYFFDATPLSNLADLFQKNAYDKEADIAGNIWENTIEDFASGLIPAQVKAIAKTVDTTQRQTYDPDNKFASFVNGIKAGIPELSKTLPVKYDTWGEPMTYGSNSLEAGASKLIYPGEHTIDTSDEVDNEINRIFNEVQDTGIFPQTSPNKVDGVNLTAQQKSDYQHDIGVRNRDMFEQFMRSDVYQSLDDTTRNEITKKLFGASKAMTERDVLGKAISDNSQYKKAINAYESNNLDDFFKEESAKGATKEITGDIATNSNAFKAVQEKINNGDIEGAEQLGTAYEQLKELGASTAIIGGWDNASKAIPELDPPTYYKQYSSIDSMDNKNGKISMGELETYINRYADSERQAQELWNAYYGGWKNKAGDKKLLKKENGVYVSYYP